MVAQVIPIGEDHRVPLDAIVDGLLRVPPDLRLAAMAEAFVASCQRKPITLTDRKIVIDPVSEEIPLDFLDE